MRNIDITKEIYSEGVEKSPPFAKDIVVTFSDDCSTDTMKAFKEGKSWKDAIINELILDWNLGDGEGKKLPINVESLDKIKSIKLRDWIIDNIGKVMIEGLAVVKKK